MQIEKKQRSSNIELLRVVAMFMIILFHITMHCITRQLTDPASIGKTVSAYFSQPLWHSELFILALLNTLGAVSNGIFILITGYFMATRNKETIFIDSIAQKLIFQLGFATLLIVCIPPCLHLIRPSTHLNMVGISIFNNELWFIGYYFIIICCGRLFYNNFLSKLDAKKYTGFLIVLFAFSQFQYSRASIEAIFGGMGTLCIGLFFYALGGYIKQYNPFDKFKISTLLLVLAIIIGLILLSCYNLTETKALNYVTGNNAKPFIPTIPGYDNFRIVTVVSTICLFELFRRIQLPVNVIINYLGKSTFMVYLFHENAFFHGLWNHRDWLQTLADNPLWFTFHLLKWGTFTFMLGVIAYALYNLSMKALRSNMHLFIKSGRPY